MGCAFVDFLPPPTSHASPPPPRCLPCSGASPAVAHDERTRNTTTKNEGNRTKLNEKDRKPFCMADLNICFRKNSSHFFRYRVDIHARPYEITLVFVLRPADGGWGVLWYTSACLPPLMPLETQRKRPKAILHRRPEYLFSQELKPFFALQGRYSF